MSMRDNYLLVKNFLEYLGRNPKIGPDSLTRYWFSLRHLLLWAGDCPLTQAHKIKPAFPDYVAALPSPRGKSCLSDESQDKAVSLARRFFEWARRAQPADFRQIPPLWIEMLQPKRPEKPESKPEHQYVTLEEAIQLATYPIDRSNLALWATQAAVAMLFLSGQRATAFTTMPIQAVHLEQRCVDQKPELGMRIKFGKSDTTSLLPIPELLAVVEEWDSFVRSQLSPQAPWYAPVDNHWSEMSLSIKAPGKNRSISLIHRLRKLYQVVGLPYKHPHLFRHGHAVYGLQHSETMAQYQAVSRNLMHSSIHVTDSIYAGLGHKERSEIYAGLGSEKRSGVIAGVIKEPPSHPGDDLETLIAGVNPAEASRAIKILAARYL